MIASLNLRVLADRFGGEIMPNSHAIKENMDNEIAIENASADTRNIHVGDTFVALKGESFDGHDFLSVAKSSGATVLVVSKEDKSIDLPQWVVADTTIALGHIAMAHRELFSGRLVAITGSGGKTTVKGMLQSILQSAAPDKVFATHGNLNNHIGVPLSLLSLQAQHEYAVIEMGASGLGEIDYLTHLGQPDVALVNNVMPAHVEGFGSVDNIATAKGEIYDGLSASGIAIVNIDDSYSAQWLQKNSNRQIITFSVNPSAVNLAKSMKSDQYVFASDVQLLANGCPCFQLYFSDSLSALPTSLVTLRELGLHNVSNALAAASCAIAIGIDVKHIVLGLENFNGVSGRLEVLCGVGQSTVIDDSYNANPGSVKAAIDVLSEMSAYKVLIIGDMAELGEDAILEHQLIGRYASNKKIDCVLSLGLLSEHISMAFSKHSSHFSDIESLLSHANSMANNNTVFLIKGSRNSRMDRVVYALKQRGDNKKC